MKPTIPFRISKLLEELTRLSFHYQIDFAVENRLRRVLGFDARINEHGRYESENLVDIMVHCDIIGTSRVNVGEAPVIYNFFPNAAPGVHC